MAFVEYPKWLYKNGVCSLLVNDLEEQEVALKDGYELPPPTGEELPPCEHCAALEAKIQDLEQQLEALVAKRSRGSAAKE